MYVQTAIYQFTSDLPLKVIGIIPNGFLTTGRFYEYDLIGFMEITYFWEHV
jgi:hypothetical protein